MTVTSRTDAGPSSPTPTGRSVPTDAPSADDRSLVLVVGSGRSGTSLLAGTLQRLGMHVPQPEVPPDQSNPQGFAEPQWVVDFHDRLLARSGLHMADARPGAWMLGQEHSYDAEVRSELAEWLAGQFAIGDQLVVKDPRLLWFVSLWLASAGDLGVEPAFVTVLRHPSQVVGSKERWYGAMSNPSHRVAGWINTMLFSERATRGHRRSYARFDGLMTDWTREISKIDADVGLPVVRRAGMAQMQAASRAIRPGNWRSHETWESLDVPDRLTGIADRLWAELVELAEPAVTDPSAAHDRADRLEAIRDDYSRLYAEAEAIAHSSVVAARARPAVSTTPSPARPGRFRRRLTRVVADLARLTPTRLTSRLPAGLRSRVRRWVS
jgi:hypothetical protein